MIIHVQFGLSQFISFRREILKFQPISTLLALAATLNITGRKNSYFVEDHPCIVWVQLVH
jgi:hypothetical protein